MSKSIDITGPGGLDSFVHRASEHAYQYDLELRLSKKTKDDGRRALIQIDKNDDERTVVGSVRVVTMGDTPCVEYSIKGKGRAFLRCPAHLSAIVYAA